MKLLHSKVDILKKNSEFLSQNCPWVSKYVNFIPVSPENTLNFACLNDEQYNSGRNGVASQTNNIDKYLKDLE